MHEDRGSRRYWELSNDERGALAPELISRYEQEVLAAINHGRSVSSIEWTVHPTLRHLVPAPEGELGSYAVTITAILAAAVVDGYEPDYVYEEALHWLDEWHHGDYHELAPRGRPLRRAPARDWSPES